MDAETARAVCTLRPASGDAAYVIIYDDDRGAGEANIRVAFVTPHGHLRIAFHRGAFGSEDAAHRAAASVANVIEDIQADVIPSFGGALDRGRAARPRPARSTTSRSSSSGPTTGPSSPTRSRPSWPIAIPALARRLVTVADTEGAAPAEQRRFFFAEPLDGAGLEADELLRLMAEHGVETTGLDRRAAFAEACRATIQIRRGPRRPRIAAVVRVRPDGPRARGPARRWLRSVASAALGAGGHDGRHPPRRAKQRDRRRTRGRGDHDPGRALRSSVAPPAPCRRARRTPASVGGGTDDDDHRRARRRAPSSRSVRRRPGPHPRRPCPARVRGRGRGGNSSSSPRGRSRSTCMRSCEADSACTTASAAITDLGAGSTVGELAALVPEPRSASVTALEPTTLLRIDRPLLEELLADRPALAHGIIGALVAMVRERARSEADTTPGVTGPLQSSERSRPLADGPGGGIRRDGRVAGHRRQRDVPRRVRIGLAAR